MNDEFQGPIDLETAQAHAESELSDGWEIIEKPLPFPILKKDYDFVSYAEAVRFVSKVAELAEEVGHRPDMWLASRNEVGKLRVGVWSQALNNLTMADFDFAKKIDQIT